MNNTGENCTVLTLFTLEHNRLSGHTQNNRLMRSIFFPSFASLYFAHTHWKFSSRKRTIQFVSTYFNEMLKWNWRNVLMGWWNRLKNANENGFNGRLFVLTKRNFFLFWHLAILKFFFCCMCFKTSTSSPLIFIVCTFESEFSNTISKFISAFHLIRMSEFVKNIWSPTAAIPICFVRVCVSNFESNIFTPFSV